MRMVLMGDWLIGVVMVAGGEVLEMVEDWNNNFVRVCLGTSASRERTYIFVRVKIVTLEILKIYNISDFAPKISPF